MSFVRAIYLSSLYLFGGIILIGFNGCGSSNVVTIYTSVDQDYAEPIINGFQELHPELQVQAVYDSEMTKTTGLYERLIHERRNPQADVFWNNEIIRTIQLKHQGILQPYESPSAADIDAKFKDPEHYWTGFSVRARVMIINKDLVPDTETPSDIPALGDFRYKGKTGMANPQFGTTAGHMASIYILNDPGIFRLRMQNYMTNQLKILPGNSTVRDQVAQGLLAYGLTDSDDAYSALDEGKPVRMVFLGQEKDGTYLIPNTVSMIKDAPHPDHAKALLDYLLSPETEEKLAFSRAKQIPVRSTVNRPEGLPDIASIKAANVNYDEAAKQLEACLDLLREYSK